MGVDLRFGAGRVAALMCPRHVSKVNPAEPERGRPGPFTSAPVRLPYNARKQSRPSSPQSPALRGEKEECT